MLDYYCRVFSTYGLPLCEFVSLDSSTFPLSLSLSLSPFLYHSIYALNTQTRIRTFMFFIQSISSSSKLNCTEQETRTRFILPKQRTRLKKIERERK